MENITKTTRGLLFRGAKEDIFFIHDSLLPFFEIKDEKVKEHLKTLLDSNLKNNLIGDNKDVLHITIEGEIGSDLNDERYSILKKYLGKESINPDDLYFPW